MSYHFECTGGNVEGISPRVLVVFDWTSFCTFSLHVGLLNPLFVSVTPHLISQQEIIGTAML